MYGNMSMNNSMVGQSRGSRMPPSGAPYGNSSSAKPQKARQERQTNFKVVIRVRPPLPRELSGEVPFRNVIAVDDREQCITISENIEAVVDNEGQVLANPGPYTTYSFMFDYVYDQQCNQEKVYETTARNVVDSALQGYNATIFAYGQTGAGKTYTMEGFNREGSIESRGIIPRAIEQIFNHIHSYAGPRMRFLVRASYLQIYNEQISDLLKPERNNLQIREDKKRGVYVDGLSEWVVRSPAEIYGLMERGASVRATGETKMNEVSSRSHAVFIVIAEQSQTVYVDDHGEEMSPEEFQRFMHDRGVRREQEMSRLEDLVRQTFKVGKLNLVDLAGSERVQRSGATGQRLEESKQINKSLTMLGYVISALTEAKDRQHIPYRNSKLTRMLEDSLGGNCKTTMMAMISPAFEAMLETISTLKFANRAKNIRNEARVNEDLDQKSLLRKYERELKKLRAELDERSKNVVDKRRLLELDEQRKRAEADKMAAIRALEARSMEFMKEKEEKKKLEQRIAMLMGQMLRGEKLSPDVLQSHYHGSVEAVQDHEYEVVMKEQQDKLRQEYEFKLADLERERETIEEEKAQVDRYKQLLLKQRDIMIALTQRLVERDEQIMSLQDELDAYDRHHKELEEKLDEKTAMLIKFQRISMEVNATSPYKSDELNKALLSEQQQQQDIANNRLISNRVKELDDGPMEITQDDDNDTTTTTTSPTPSIPPPPPSSFNRLQKSKDNNHFNNNNINNNINNNTDEKTTESNHLLALQAKQIQQLEQKVATQQLSYSRIEKLLSKEMSKFTEEIVATAPPQVHTSLTIAMKEHVKSLLSDFTAKLKDHEDIGRNLEDDYVTKERSDEELALLRDENERLKRMVTKQRSGDLTNNNNGTETSTEQQKILQTKCDTLIKEREAVQTIMEQKIKVLVQSVAQSTTALVNTLVNSDNPNNLPTSQALAKDVAALQRLVNASIAALRNAASATSPTPPPSNPPANNAMNRNVNAVPPPPSLSSSTSSLPPPLANPALRSSFEYGSGGGGGNGLSRPPGPGPTIASSSSSSSAPASLPYSFNAMSDNLPGNYNNNNNNNANGMSGIAMKPAMSSNGGYNGSIAGPNAMMPPNNNNNSFYRPTGGGNPNFL